MQPIFAEIKSFFPALLIILCLACTGKDRNEGSAPIHSNPDWNISAIPGSMRILRDQTAAPSNTISLSAARNEWESFQIIVRSDREVSGVTLEAGELTGPEGAKISPDHSVLYRAHQLYIDKPSNWNGDFQTGWYPDALIPFKDPLTGTALKGRLQAVPFILPAYQSHGFWIDIFVPADAVSGIYTGIYTVKWGGGIAEKITVSLHVRNFTLPAVTTLKTEFGVPEAGIRTFYAAKNQDDMAYWSKIVFQLNKTLSEHRLNPVRQMYTIDVNPDANGNFTLNQNMKNDLQNFINSYSLNAIRLPFFDTDYLSMVVFGNPGFTQNDMTADLTPLQKTKLENYMISWNNVAAGLTVTSDIQFFIYLSDEPSTRNAYRFVSNLGSMIRGLSLSHIKVLVAEQTFTEDPAWGDLYGAVDIWCPVFPYAGDTTVKTRQTAGEKVWAYTALSNDAGSPKWLTDFPPVHYRAPAWIIWQQRLDGLLYWTTTNWNQATDPWKNPVTWTVNWQGQSFGYNGEGCLLYPGEDAGYDGVAPSIRLKIIRDSLEDYEYLALCDSKGLTQAAGMIVTPIASSWNTWSKDASAYENARKALADLIESN